jgi:hypothetical protein
MIAAAVFAAPCIHCQCALQLGLLLQRASQQYRCRLPDGGCAAAHGRGTSRLVSGLGGRFTKHAPEAQCLVSTSRHHTGGSSSNMQQVQR